MSRDSLSQHFVSWLFTTLLSCRMKTTNRLVYNNFTLTVVLFAFLCLTIAYAEHIPIQTTHLKRCGNSSISISFLDNPSPGNEAITEEDCKSIGCFWSSDINALSNSHCLQSSNQEPEKERLDTSLATSTSVSDSSSTCSDCCGEDSASRNCFGLISKLLLLWIFYKELSIELVRYFLPRRCCSPTVSPTPKQSPSPIQPPKESPSPIQPPTESPSPAQPPKESLRLKAVRSPSPSPEKPPTLNTTSSPVQLVKESPSPSPANVTVMKIGIKIETSGGPDAVKLCYNIKEVVPCGGPNIRPGRCKKMGCCYVVPAVPPGTNCFYRSDTVPSAVLKRARLRFLEIWELQNVKQITNFGLQRC